MHQLLNKGQIIDAAYEVQFIISGNDYLQKYRVKNKDGKIYQLKLYNSFKLSPYQFTEDNELLETEILKKINHHNIIKFENNGEIVLENQKYHYLILNFISGETLKDKIKREGIFSPYIISNLLEELLSCLDYLHNQNEPIIHNNINPETVWIDFSENTEKIILSDLNFARYLTSKGKSINTKQLNPFYSAPELLNGIFTKQSDIFSVGALMYHLIIGSPPWHIEISDFQFTETKFKAALTEQRERPLTFGIPGFKEIEDEHVINTLKKALAVNVEDRFKNATEFLKAIKRETVLATSNTEKTLTRKKHIEDKKSKGFSEIAGMQELKDILFNDVIRAIEEKELYESYGITIPNGMLLYGPPGCGKTFISEKFAEEVGYNFYQLKPSDIKSRFVNATEENIGNLFKEATKNAPSIIFIDEVDALMPSRENDLHQMHSSVVNEFLAQMSNCSEKGIFIILASNRPEKIDSAILRTGRIDRIIYLPPPDKEAREKMFKLYLMKRPIDLGVDFEKLAKLTELFVSSDIKTLCDKASREAIKSKERITQKILETIISSSRPSVSQSEIQKYEILRQKFEDINLRPIQNDRKKIGFK